MKNELAKVMEVLQVAVQMEVDGKKFYQKASSKSSNRLARELFQQLAKEEDVHRKKFEEICKAVKKGQDWPDIEAPFEKGKTLKSLFAEATKGLGNKFRVAESELEAIKIAMDMEVRSYNLYYTRSAASTLLVEKQFYKTLAGEERGHHLALLDSYEYLSDPAGWFTRLERNIGHWTELK